MSTTTINGQSFHFLESRERNPFDFRVHICKNDFVAAVKVIEQFVSILDRLRTSTLVVKAD